MRLLVIEDENLIAEGIKLACIAEGFVCQIAENGNDGLEMIHFYDYDIIILDLLLPDMSGHEILAKIRMFKRNIPVIVLSGLNSTEEKIKCFSNGADDYLTKPFSRNELLARIYAIMRRASGHYSSILEIGTLAIDFNNKIVTIYGQEVQLTNKEYTILELLMFRRGSIISKETFLNHIYGGMDEPDLKIVDVFICKLRKKMAKVSGGINFIKTIWGRGYSVKEQEEIEQEHPSFKFNRLKAG
ncbi:MAG: response regulator transcription factor [Holosporales bacterium]|nr:response regulator transcription factor [Holosporales bacterium]